MVDMAERTMMVTLNGELLFNDRGSEVAARDFDVRDGPSQLPQRRTPLKPAVTAVTLECGDLFNYECTLRVFWT